MSEKKKKKKFAWLKWLGVLLILIISLGLIFHNEIANFTLKSFEPQVTKQSIKAGQKETGELRLAESGRFNSAAGAASALEFRQD
ncbi:hypothetical protein [Weissella confusa]|uniref:hypothetical protein n=1 Tax=Weissella confusa TaxID=1583 RepID=UPI0021648C2B|nr:hypothetical protein [Weissella confusa]